MSDKPAYIVIDGTKHPADPSRNLLEIALELGYDLPYFCWHPELGSVGACRQCAVTQYADDQDERGRIVMACMTPCQGGARFSLDDAQSAEMRRSVIEFLMTNHPHDCPVCEEGGNCHLQDMTQMTGHSYRRYRHTKRTHRNQDLGPLVAHEMNRCIACYRCVRYYRDYAGGHDLEVFGAHNHVYFGRAQDGILESPFAGNLVEVCPTGVFTDKPYGDSYTRKWDLQQAPSVCAHCAVGCNLMPGERYGRIKRVENRYHEAINGYFLCDRGRYGYAYTNDPQRPRHALSGRAEAKALEPRAALQQLADWIAEGDAIGVGSPRASLESNHALRALLGAEQFYRGESRGTCALDDLALELLRDAPVQVATLRDIENADSALVLGEDLLNTAPRLELALRQMTRNLGFELARQAHVPTWQDQSVRLLAQQQRSALFIATPATTSLDAMAQWHWRSHPDGIARLGHAVAHALDPAAPPPASGQRELMSRAGEIADTLLAAKRPLLVSGHACQSLAVLHATAAVARAYHRATGRRLHLALALPEANTLGTAMLGGATLDELCHRADAAGIRTLIVLENDLRRRLPEAQLRQLLERSERLVVIDHLPPDTPDADLLLPAATVFEATGSFVNHAGRVQRFVQTFSPEGDQRASWCWLQHTARLLDRDLGLDLDALTKDCAATHPLLSGMLQAAPAADFRLGGARIPRQPHRYSGRTAMQAHRDIHEIQPTKDPDSAFSFSMEGVTTTMDKPASAVPLVWFPRWNSPQAINKFQSEIGGPWRGGNPGIPLLHGGTDDHGDYAEPPAPSSALQTVPLWHVFGSEELSNRSPALRERGLAGACVALHPDTADRLGLASEPLVLLEAPHLSLILPLQLRADLDPQSVGLPAGVEGLGGGLFGLAVTLRPTPEAQA